MYTTLIFDLGGVLFTNGTKHVINHICTTYNLEHDFVKEVMDGEIGSEYRENKIDQHEFWRKAINEMNIEGNGEELNNIWLEGYQLDFKVRDLILQLKDSYKIYYLSDNVPNRVEYLQSKYSFLDWFDGGVFSYDVNVRKPNEKIYTLALEEALAKAEESVFIDDKPSALEPAKKLGITPVLFESAEQISNDLQKLGIEMK